MDFERLIDLAIERIRPYLPQDHEIDDVSWGDGIFQICIFDVSLFPGRLVDRLRFMRMPGETKAETYARFEQTLTEYTMSWR